MSGTISLPFSRHGEGIGIALLSATRSGKRGSKGLHFLRWDQKNERPGKSQFLDLKNVEVIQERVKPYRKSSVFLGNDSGIEGEVKSR
jgi:hypothetical protein